MAESLALAGDKLEATVLLSRAASLWSTAAPPAPLSVAPQDTTTRPPAPAPPGPVVPAPRPNPTGRTDPGSATTSPVPIPTDSAAVSRFYVELQQAIRARQLGEVQRLLPNLTENESREWREIFLDDNIGTIEPLYEVLLVSRQGEVVYARVREQLTLVRVNGKVDRKRDRVIATRLTLGPQGWRQIRWEKL